MSDNKVRLTGLLWKNESEKGSIYLVGSMSPSSKLLVLENQYKESQGDPDYVAVITKNERKKIQKSLREKKRRSYCE